jgi:hypothetical protein
MLVASALEIDTAHEAEDREPEEHITPDRRAEESEDGQHQPSPFMQVEISSSRRLQMPKQRLALTLQSLPALRR